MKVKTMSYSFMEVYMDCPLRHHMRYTLKTPPMESDNTALQFGSLIHRVLEELRNDPVEKLIPKMVDRAAGEMDFDMKPSVISKSKEVLVDWVNTRDFDGYDVMATEWRFDKQLPSGNFNINGFIDLVEMNDDGVIRVTDYKSGRFIYTMEDLMDSLQLMMYAISVFDEWKPNGIEVSYDMVQMGKIVYKVKKSDIVNSIKRIKRIKKLIESDTKHRPNLSFKCGWCDYRYKCKAFQSLGDMEKDGLVVELDTMEQKVREYKRLSDLAKAIDTRKSDIKVAVEKHLNEKPDSPVVDYGDIKARMVYGKETIYDAGVVSSIIPIEDISLVMDVRKGRMDSYIESGLAKGTLTQAEIDTIKNMSETRYKRGYVKVD